MAVSGPWGTSVFVWARASPLGDSPLDRGLPLARGEASAISDRLPLPLGEGWGEGFAARTSSPPATGLTSRYGAHLPLRGSPPATGLTSRHGTHLSAAPLG